MLIQDKCLYSIYGIGFDSRSEFSLPDSSVSKNVITFWHDMSSSVHTDNKKKQRLEDTTLTTEVQYSINFLGSNRTFCLSLHYSRINIFLFVNATKIYQFKAKTSKIRKYLLCLENTAGGFSVHNMKNKKQKKPGLNG